MNKEEADGTRGIVARAFTVVEDIVYVGLGALLAVSALLLLVTGAMAFAREISTGVIAPAVVGVLDRLLLTLMIVELLYTVQVSFREHAVVPEPFLIVALVAAVRRILVLTAEFGDLKTVAPEVFRTSMIELSVLTLMTVAFVASLLMLRHRHPEAVAKRS
jgi:hypothetical protein